eukprot:TRINITY_DN26806_c0_g1_i1.p2 TRINITY_DN26806_c0_g1~~TRINITY_DN26806_c0_g1_i1.p2  ORF type:complete len:108 (-),score=2.45 TRINITY_DN26806_c0_g1_i1:200-523(-)
MIRRPGQRGEASDDGSVSGLDDRQGRALAVAQSVKVDCGGTVAALSVEQTPRCVWDPLTQRSPLMRLQNFGIEKALNPCHRTTATVPSTQHQRIEQVFPRHQSYVVE